MEGVHFLEELAHVLDLVILSWLGVDALEVVSKDDSLRVQDLFFRQVEGRELLDQQVYEELTVFLGGETIVIDSHVLVVPASNESRFVGTELSRQAAHTLEHPGNVSQVESIVAFRRSRQQFAPRFVVNHQHRVHDKGDDSQNFLLLSNIIF